MTRYLHEGFMRTAVRAKDGRNANHSLASDDGDLSPASCDTSDGDDRSQSSIYEANLFYPTIGRL
jgi:hypothetical protein